MAAHTVDNPSFAGSQPNAIAAAAIAGNGGTDPFGAWDSADGGGGGGGGGTVQPPPPLAAAPSKALGAGGGSSGGRGRPSRLVGPEARPCSQGAVIYPLTRWKRYWDGYVLLLVLYSATYELVQLTFHPAAEMSGLDIFVDCSYWIDIVLTCTTGYVLEDGTLVMEPRKILRRYATSFLVPDVVSNIPYGQISSPSSQQQQHWGLLRLLRSTRLLRILRAGGGAREVVNHLVSALGVRAAIIDILRFVLGIMLVSRPFPSWDRFHID
jgi:hypothetical protein